MEKEIKQLYLNFFQELGINESSGLFNNSDSKIRFATYPYIGKRYAESKLKILFVGLDIGQQERSYIQDIVERRNSIALDCDFNPHIAGTYTTALFYLKDIYNWNDSWGRVITYSTSQQATRIKQHNGDDNPLHYIALSNYFKFVGIDRVNRSGADDRKYVKADTEKRLLLNEIEILKPDIVIFQGNSPYFDVIHDIKKMNIKTLKIWHPSLRKKGARQPLMYIGSIHEV